MQEGGTDIVELGMPFSDPIADGPTIQESNTVCLQSFTLNDKIFERGTHRLLLKTKLSFRHVSNM